MTITGGGLSILITCDYSTHHDWMSFLCWYSISKNLPDAKVAVACNRDMSSVNLFTWPKKCGVPLYFCTSTDRKGQVEAVESKIPLPILAIPPETVCIRDFGESGTVPEFEGIIFLGEELCGDCRKDRNCPFVTYSDGWGSFVLGDWINRTRVPLVQGADFGRGAETANEVRIGRLWKAAAPLFQTVSR